ncbi:MAG TPA: NAD-dependent succinate-semialdehyde dehydrogenase [Salinivirgaceae bacterium]|nr:NAD-dependent succinate-semialdehyde dehydrogenase [Salinivirgaceae bacterium]
MRTIESKNPYTGEIIAEYNLYDNSRIDKLLQAAAKLQNHWSQISMERRSELFLSLASLLRKKRDKLAILITNEMGKVLVESEAEVEKCALVCEYYAKNAKDFLSPINIETEYTKSYVVYNPLGVILAIMPWNFPFWQVFRAAAPILMAGNTIVLKHASNVSGCALAIEKLFVEAGFEENILTTILIRGNEASSLIEDKRISAVTITGSTEAGIAVATVAGRNLKKAVLELGGSDPYIILADADLNSAAEKCVSGRLLNAGQSCIGAKRFIVVDEVYDQFVTIFAEKMSRAKTGNPLEKATNYGPLAKIEFCHELNSQVKNSVSAGAEILIGEISFNENKPIYMPTIITNVKPGMSAYHDELFGPVASVIRVKDEKEAIFVANDTMFGLGAAIFTKDVEKGTRIAQNHLQSGCCFINDFVKSDPRLPFGGIKNSGYGRELSLWGIKEFTNVKTVVVK